jgi:hypothetical protein
MAGTGMIGAILALQLTTAPPVVAVAERTVTAVTYEDVPPEVARVSIHGWEDEASPVPVAAGVERQGDRLIVRAASGRRSLVLFERADGAYLVDGPFWWPATDAGRVLDRRWRRTIAVASPEPIPDATAFEWVSAGSESGVEWPRCFRSGERLWTCWGAAVGEPGVIVCRAVDRVWWTVVSRGPAPNLRSSNWGRLLLVPEGSGDQSELRVRFAHPVAQSSQRLPGVRLETADVTAAQSTSVARGAVWVSGEGVPSSGWIEVRTAHFGPAYLALQDVAGGSPSLPLTVRLEETRVVDGIAVGVRDQPASGAMVTLFRLIDPPRSARDPSRERPRRVFVAETIADAGGTFHIDGAGDAEYEVVAWHPQLGRASAMLPRTPGVFTVRLESPGTVRGRVLIAGKPLAAVDVISLPGPEAFRRADDLVDLKGGDTRTGPDGRFAVMLAAGGGGELRVGGGTVPIKRIPLPRAPAPVLDLGDIELGSPLEITIVLDQDSTCELRATGPVGQSGLQIVPGVRTGPGLFRMILPEPGLWAFGLFCGRDERPLAPSTVQIGSANAGKEVRFSIR